MRSILRMSFDSGAARLRDVERMLEDLCERRAADATSLAQMQLPGWLEARFSETTREELIRLREEWKRASPVRRVEIEDKIGWRRSGWLHWFSTANDYWRLVRVDADAETSEVILHIEHEDLPFPMEALEWLADGADALLSGPERETWE